MGKVEQSGDMVTSTEIAKLIGKTSRTVQQLTSDGVLPTLEVKNKTRTTRKYDKYKTVQAYIAYVEKRIAEKHGGDKENEKIQIEIDTRRIKLRVAQLQLEELEGRMHSAEDVENMTTDLALSVRSNLMAMPGQLAVDLADINDASEIAVKIQDVIYKILSELSEYEYNPEEYKKRVRERQGWLNNEQEDEEDK